MNKLQKVANPKFWPIVQFRYKVFKLYAETVNVYSELSVPLLS
jgi:hypothetical protein